MRWWVLFALAGCGDNVVDVWPGDHGGSELRLYWWEYAGGARDHIRGGYDDTRLGPCQPITWADDVMRCTPGVSGFTPRAFTFPPTYTRGVFADPACTQLVSTQAEYVIVEDGGRPAQVFRGNGPPRLDVTAYYVRDGGVCGGPLPSSGVLYSVGAAIPTAELVVVEDRILPSSGRLAHRARVGTDGTEERIGFYDVELETPCGATLRGDCAPDAVATADLFLDAACTRPAVASTTPPRFAATADARYFRVGAPAARVFRRDSAGCNNTTLEIGEIAYAIGEPVALARVEFVNEPVADRRLGDWIVVAGSVRANLGLFDTVTDAPCSALGLGSKDRCVPTACCQMLQAFADPACASPIDFVFYPQDPVYRYFTFTRSGDDFFEIRDPIAVFAPGDDGTCAPISAPGFDTRALGPRRPSTSFPLATLVVD